jgi:hypothetical protein
VTQRVGMERNSNRASGKKWARYRTKTIPETTHFYSEDGIRPCHRPEDHNVCCPKGLQTRISCWKVGRIAICLFLSVGYRLFQALRRLFGLWGLLCRSTTRASPWCGTVGLPRPAAV